MGTQKQILLTQGKVALVDDKDYEWLNQWKWGYSHGYAKRIEHDYSDGWRNRRAKRIYMHRLIMGMAEGGLVDHINRDSLDNRRENLRVADKSVNAVNSKLRKDNSSGHKGVYIRSNGKYTVQIKRDGVTKTIGTFDSLNKAVEARCEASLYTK